jgi:hypothetical protein
MFAIVIQKDRDPSGGPVPTDDEKLRQHAGLRWNLYVL